jgi:hypothetical protein
MLKCVFALMLVTSPFLLAQSNEVAHVKRIEFVLAMKPVVSYDGLLGDITNRTPGIGVMFGARIYTGNPNFALALNLCSNTWGWHHFRNTTHERTRVARQTVAAGILYFIGTNPNPDYSYYLGIEGGVNAWHINSHTYSPLDDNKYLKPVRILKFGKGFQDTLFVEFGVERLSLDASKVEFKKYKESNVALTVALGLRNVDLKFWKKKINA